MSFTDNKFKAGLILLPLLRLSFRLLTVQCCTDHPWTLSACKNVANWRYLGDDNACSPQGNNFKEKKGGKPWERNERVREPSSKLRSVRKCKSRKKQVMLSYEKWETVNELHKGRDAGMWRETDPLPSSPFLSWGSHCQIHVAGDSRNQ